MEREQEIIREEEVKQKVGILTYDGYLEKKSPAHNLWQVGCFLLLTIHDNTHPQFVKCVTLRAEAMVQADHARGGSAECGEALRVSVHVVQEGRGLGDQSPGRGSRGEHRGAADPAASFLSE